MPFVQRLYEPKFMPEVFLVGVEGGGLGVQTKTTFPMMGTDIFWNNTSFIVFFIYG